MAPLQALDDLVTPVEQIGTRNRDHDEPRCLELFTTAAIPCLIGECPVVGGAAGL